MPTTGARRRLRLIQASLDEGVRIISFFWRDPAARYVRLVVTVHSG